MCGICGDLRVDPEDEVAPAILAAMNDAQRHRGPDDEGVWTSGPVGFGHRRLAILDLAGGSQPMVDREREVAVTYNGEIYNYIELRQVLEGRGYQFRTGSDTEVLLAGYLAWGTEVVRRISGMFAFGVYDLRRGCLFAARDPVGQKPFLYFRDARGLVFSSELTGLMRHPRVPRELDLDAVAGYLVREAFASPETPLRGVRKLLPGHALEYRPRTDTLRTWRYWAPEEAVMPASGPAAAEGALQQFSELLRGAMIRHLRSDVPVGLYLSGGVDSTALAVAAADIAGGGHLRTFTIAHVEPSYDEATLARRTAQQLGTQHHELRLTDGQCCQSVPSAVEQLDEPLADLGYLSIFQAAALASQHVKVVISGDGGDELFWGYEPFRVWRASEWIYQCTSARARRVFRRLVDAFPGQYGYMGLGYRASVFARGLEVPAPIRNAIWLSAFTPEEAEDVLRAGRDLAVSRRDASGRSQLFDPVWALHEHMHSADSLVQLGLEYQLTYLPDCICAHTDKANMRFSLEARSPFLDPAIVRFANSLPAEWKLRGSRTKWVMRRWVAQRLGRSVPLKKRGFTVPMALWLRRQLRAYAWQFLNPDALNAVGLFRPHVVERLWREHQQGRANHAKKLWALIVMQSWCIHQWRRVGPLSREGSQSLRPSPVTRGG